MKLHLNEKICETTRWMVELVQDRFRWLPIVLGFSTFVYCCHSVKSRILSKLYQKSHKCVLQFLSFCEPYRTCCVSFVQVFNLKVDRILIWVIYLPRFKTCYITQLTCIYSKCWKWCPFISMHLSTRFTTFLATFLSVLSFFNHFAIALLLALAF